MNQKSQDVKGRLSITLHDSASDRESFSVKISDCSVHDFMTAATNIAKGLSPQKVVNFPNWNKVAGSFTSVEKVEVDAADQVRQDGLNFYRDELSTASVKNVEAGEKMSDFTKSELQAHLNANKAEVESVAASMRTEMANFRTAYVESFKDISVTLNKIDSRAEATEKRLTQAQWIVSLVISISAVTLSAVIYFSNKTANRPVQQPAVVVNTAQPMQNEKLSAPNENQKDNANPVESKPQEK